jgi:hypothetical protein
MEERVEGDQVIRDGGDFGGKGDVGGCGGRQRRCRGGKGVEEVKV